MIEDSGSPGTYSTADAGAVGHQLIGGGLLFSFHTQRRWLGFRRVVVLHHQTLPLRVPVEPNFPADDDVRVRENEEGHYEDGEGVEGDVGAGHPRVRESCPALVVIDPDLLVAKDEWLR